MKQKSRETINQLAIANSSVNSKSGDQNIKIANELVNRLTEELTKRDEEIFRLQQKLKEFEE